MLKLMKEKQVYSVKSKDSVYNNKSTPASPCSKNKLIDLLETPTLRLGGVLNDTLITNLYNDKNSLISPLTMKKQIRSLY